MREPFRVQRAISFDVASVSAFPNAVKPEQPERLAAVDRAHRPQDTQPRTHASVGGISYGGAGADGRRLFLYRWRAIPVRQLGGFREREQGGMDDERSFHDQ